MLISEGVPASEIQNLCDLHVAVVRESLDKQQPQESIPGHPIYTFQAENKAVTQLLQSLHEEIENLEHSLSKYC